MRSEKVTKNGPQHSRIAEISTLLQEIGVAESESHIGIITRSTNIAQSRMCSWKFVKNDPKLLSYCRNLNTIIGNRCRWVRICDRISNRKYNSAEWRMRSEKLANKMPEVILRSPYRFGLVIYLRSLCHRGHAHLSVCWHCHFLHK